MFSRLDRSPDGQSLSWNPVDPVLKDPNTMYAAASTPGKQSGSA